MTFQDQTISGRVGVWGDDNVKRGFEHRLLPRCSLAASLILAGSHVSLMSYGAQSHCVSPHIASHCLHNDHIASCTHKHTHTHTNTALQGDVCEQCGRPDGGLAVSSNCCLSVFLPQPIHSLCSFSLPFVLLYSPWMTWNTVLTVINLVTRLFTSFTKITIGYTSILDTTLCYSLFHVWKQTAVWYFFAKVTFSLNGRTMSGQIDAKSMPSTHQGYLLFLWQRQGHYSVITVVFPQILSVCFCVCVAAWMTSGIAVLWIVLRRQKQLFTSVSANCFGGRFVFFATSFTSFGKASRIGIANPTVWCRCRGEI